MNQIVQNIMETLSTEQVTTLASRIGAEPEKTQAGIAAAVPALVGSLAKNAASDDGANSLLSALNKDHSGGLMGRLEGLLAGGGGGQGILKHVLGSKQPVVEASVAQASGLETSQASELIAALAPIVMGALGDGKLDLGSLRALLGGGDEAGEGLLDGLAGMAKSLFNKR